MQQAIIYFSGTGGTQYVAKMLHDLLDESTALHALPSPLTAEAIADNQRIYLLFPVYGFMPPLLLMDWLETLPDGTGKEAVVISVSGGGEIYPNTGCRHTVIEELKRHHYDVIQHRMIPMPSNWFLETPHDTALWLIKAVPIALEQMLDDIQRGKHSAPSKKMGPVRKGLSNLMHWGGRSFAQTIQVQDQCNQCAWCVTSCPVNNIHMEEKQIIFDDHCMLCFKCIYGCPQGALYSPSRQVLKKGFNIPKMVEQAETAQLPPIRSCVKGLLWVGVRRYLLSISEDIYSFI